MKEGRALDSDMAMLIMGKRPAKPMNMPHYSSNLYDAYKVVNALQSKGWHFNIKSEIAATGSMNYVIRFSQGRSYAEIQHSNIALAICNCALNIANGEVQEWQDPNRTYGEADLEKILEPNIEKLELPSDHGLKFVDVVGEEYRDKLPKHMAEFITGMLAANGLVIKKDDSDDS